MAKVLLIGRLTIALLTMVVAHSARAGADAKKELTEDISSALQLASCGRAPYAICHESDGIPDGELRARWGRFEQLCKRYRARYGDWPSNGSCDSMKRAQDSDAEKHRCYDLFRKHQRSAECDRFQEAWSFGLSRSLGAVEAAGTRLRDPETPPRLRQQYAEQLKERCAFYVKTFNEPSPPDCP